MRRAKIVATFGPAIDSYSKVESLIDAGVDVARLNMSHGDHQVHAATYKNIRAAAKKLNRTVGIMADLQGPKIRLGRFNDGPHLLNVGERFTITTRNIPGNRDICSTTYGALPKDVRPGDELLLDDGKVGLCVLEVTPTEVVTRVTLAGQISNNKGINLPGVSLSIPALTEKDEEDLRWALRHKVDFIALSFVRSASDIDRVHEVMEEEGVQLPVIAKIEKPEAILALREIIDSFDALMIARGDLGVELPLEDVPVVQKQAIELARRWAKPVIVATQVLESMIDNPRPTRAEASDCANAVLDGADAVMLSGETSVGSHPIRAVETMDRIIRSTEEHAIERIPDLGSIPQTQAGVFTLGAVEIAGKLRVNAISTFTRTGDSARRLSRLRPALPLFAFTPTEDVCNQLSLVWGICPLLSPKIKQTDDMARAMDTTLLDAGLSKPGDTVVLVASSPPSETGAVNLLKLHEIGQRVPSILAS